MAVAIHLENCGKTFPDGTRALEPIDVRIAAGETIVVLGPSGCGKTTLLRIIAGLESPDAGGRVLFDTEDVTPEPIEQRGVGMVFQSYALFPNMSVAENVGYGLRVRKWPREEREQRVTEMLGLVDLAKLGARRVDQLSGGQKQRVALARALAIRPRVLLLDEPLTALDAKLREQLRVEIDRLLSHLGITSIYVTHDQSEAMALGDRIIVMEKGRIAQTGTPQEIYHHPATAFVADFIGISNILLRDGVRFVVRPEKIRMLAEGVPADVGMTVEPGHVEQVIYAGMTTRYIVHLDHGEQLVAVRQNMDAPADAQKFEGQPVRLAWTADHTYVLDKGEVGSR